MNEDFFDKMAKRWLVIAKPEEVVGKMDEIKKLIDFESKCKGWSMELHLLGETKIQGVFELH